MPNRIETDSIIRDRQDKMKDSADQSNAEYVTQLDKSSSIMPPEKPFETEKAQKNVEVKEDKDPSPINEFVQNVKDTSNDIMKIDKNNETKLHLLHSEYEKVAGKLGGNLNSKKDEANLEKVLNDVQYKIELLKSKVKAGIMTTGGIESVEEITDEDGEGDGSGGVGEAILDGLKDQVLTAAPGIFLAAKDDEEEEEKEELTEKEIDQ